MHAARPDMSTWSIASSNDSRHSGRTADENPVKTVVLLGQPAMQNALPENTAPPGSRVTMTCGCMSPRSVGRAPSLAQFAAAAHARRHSPCSGTAIKGKAAAGMSYTAAEGKQYIITISAIPEYFQVEVNPSRCGPGARIRPMTDERIAFIEQYFTT
jgi:hypothetical protein